MITWYTGLALDAVGGGSTTSSRCRQRRQFYRLRYRRKFGIHTDTSGQVQFFAHPTEALAAFSPVSALGTASRDTLRGPHFFNFDLSVAGNFPIFGEKYKL
jgi:hypothetical protein